jgi:hypothetical protein
MRSIRLSLCAFCHVIRTAKTLTFCGECADDPGACALRAASAELISNSEADALTAAWDAYKTGEGKRLRAIEKLRQRVEQRLAAKRALVRPIEGGGP